MTSVDKTVPIAVGEAVYFKARPKRAYGDHKGRYAQYVEGVVKKVNRVNMVIVRDGTNAEWTVYKNYVRRCKKDN